MTHTVEALSFTPVSGQHGTVIHLTISPLGVQPDSMNVTSCMFFSDATTEAVFTSDIQIVDHNRYSVFSITVPLLKEDEYRFMFTLTPTSAAAGDSYIVKSGFPFIYRNQPDVHPIITRMIPSTIAASEALHTVYTLSGLALDKTNPTRCMLMPGNLRMTVLVNTYQGAKIRCSGTISSVAPIIYTVKAYDQTGNLITSEATLTVH